MQKYKTVYIGLSADALHHGHMGLLEKARNYGDIIIDSRPSDAIILSLRSNAPLYVNKSVLSNTIKDNNLDNKIEELKDEGIEVSSIPWIQDDH